MIKPYFESFTKLYSSEFTALNFIEEDINNLKSKLSISEETFNNIMVCLSEALNNAIVHAHHNNLSEKVEFHYSLHNEELIIAVKDNGPGFSIDQIPDPTAPENINKLNGRGLFLIKNLSDKMEYSLPDRKLSIHFQIN